MSAAISDSRVDDPIPVKSDAGLKTAVGQEVVPVVDSRKAFLINLALDVFFVVYLMFYIGTMAVMIIVSNNWWDLWPGVFIISPLCIGMLCLTPRMKEVYIMLYATKRAPRDDDCFSKLPASEK